MHTTMPRPQARRRAGADRKIRIGPQDNGRHMPLKQFVRAESEPGYLYELGAGVIEVTEIPGLLHHTVVRRLVRAVTAYDLLHPDVLFSMGGGAEAKMELWGREAERHPDLSIYLSPPPPGTDRPWDRWIPEIVIEVVSASSARRDYDEKPDDYLAAGVREYWIIDPRKLSGLFLVRRADMWTRKRVGRRGKWRTALLPEFTLDLARVFEE